MRGAMFLRNRLFIAFAAFFCATGQPSFAEIVDVVITFSDPLCNESCQELVARTYRGVSQVEDVTVSPGQVLLQWRPDADFSYQMVSNPMRLVGLSIHGIFVTVRGNVRVDGQKATITSAGGTTTFNLTSAPAPRAGQYVQFNNPEAFQLLADLKKQLQEAEQNQDTVIISGFLLMPHRMPLTLVVNNLSIEDDEEEQIKSR